MKAIVQDRYGTADVLELREVDAPRPRDHEVLVRVCAAGVDLGVWHLMTGRPYLVRLFLGLRAPRSRVRGMALAGRVDAVGAKVSRFRPGDEVFGAADGAFAELACAREDQLARKPRNVTFEQAAALPVSAMTALHALRDQAHVQPGQSVLVIGAGGGVGSYAVQLARHLGARVTGVCSTGKVELVRSLGAEVVIDYTREDLAGAPRHDVILDIAGNRPLGALRRLLAPRGTLVLVGGEDGGPWLGGLERTFAAMLLSPFVKQRLRGMVALERAADLELLAELVEAGKITPVVDRTFPLEQAPDAVRYVEHGKAKGKVVVSVAS